ncbi:MAG: bacteriohemerythrin [Gammaproteobacteria bacterium]|nr:bacteriohemerythrin [Gammaproteobacteria bacterium]
MKKKFGTIALALIIGLTVVAIGLGFLFGPANPIPWVLMGGLALVVFFYNRREVESQLVWKDEYSVGVEKVDDDHKQLITLLNRFQTAYEYHTGEEFERTALNELINYTRYHFDREEELMKEHEYPDIEAHKAQHAAMIAEVEQFQKDYQARGHEALEGVATYLNEWLINHINGTDKLYVPYMADKR